MKLIKFGSFPLVQIQKKEHECLDKYLLKHFSDNISFSEAITNLSLTRDTFYITPAKIIQNMTQNNSSNVTVGGKQGIFTPNNSSNALGSLRKANKTLEDQDGDENNYIDSSKRAFRILKTFYLKLSTAPFYKGMVYYPIYMEKFTGNQIKGKEISMQYKFNFILLTNNLLPSTTHEMDIDENAVINVLYIFIHLFKSDTLFGNETTKKNLTDFKKEDLIVVMKFYKLIQKFDLNPSSVFLAVYDIISFANKKENLDNFTDSVASNYSRSSGSSGTRLSSKSSKKFDPDNTAFRGIIKKVAGVVKLEMIRLRTSSNSTQSSNIMLKVIQEILDHNEIYDFIENLNEKRFSRDARMEAVADFNHYQSIIKMFEELVKYNSLELRDIIQDHDINFSKDLIITKNNDVNGTSLKGVIDRPLFDNSYSNFQTHSLNVISNMMKNLIEAQFTKANNIFHDFKNDPNYKNLIQEKLEAEDVLIQAQQARQIAENELAVAQQALNANRTDANLNRAFLIVQNKRDVLAQTVNEKSGIANASKSKVDDLEKGIKANRKFIKDKIIDGIASDTKNLIHSFGNIYEDLSNIFLNPLLLNLFIINPDLNKAFDLSSMNLNCSTLRKLIEEVGTDKFRTSSSNEEQSISILKSMFSQLNTDINFLLDMYLNNIETGLNINKVDNYNSLANGNEFNNQKNNMMDSSIDRLKSYNTVTIKDKLSIKDYEQLTETFLNQIYKFLCTDVFKPMFLKIARVKTVTDTGALYSNELNEMHPLLGKMSRNINNFKSFIFGVTTLETLYDLIVHTKEQLFYTNLLSKPIVKLASPEAKIKYVIEHVLGLNQNAVWIIGNGKVRLNMPDYLSITGIPFMSSIKQSELRGVCKIDYKKWWSEQHMGSQYNHSGINNKREVEALDKAQKKYKTDKTPSNLKILNDARKALNEINSKMESSQGEDIGNIGLNITKEAKRTFETSGFKDEVEKVTVNILDPKLFNKQEEELINQHGEDSLEVENFRKSNTVTENGRTVPSQQRADFQQQPNRYPDQFQQQMGMYPPQGMYPQPNQYQNYQNQYGIPTR